MGCHCQHAAQFRRAVGRRATACTPVVSVLIERQRLNPFALLASQGVPLAFGSDAPVTSIDRGRPCARRLDHRTTGSAISARAAFAAATRGAGGPAGSGTASPAPWCRARRPPTPCGMPGPRGRGAARRRQRWSTDPRSRVPALPRLGPTDALPTLPPDSASGRCHPWLSTPGGDGLSSATRLAPRMEGPSPLRTSVRSPTALTPNSSITPAQSPLMPRWRRRPTTSTTTSTTTTSTTTTRTRTPGDGRPCRLRWCRGCRGWWSPSQPARCSSPAFRRRTGGGPPSSPSRCCPGS